MMFRIFVVAFLCCASAWPAWASCFFPPDAADEKNVQLIDRWTARHIRDGLLEGCLAQFRLPDGKEFLAYTAYDFICSLPDGETLSVRQNMGCCDTGDEGDFVCGVKPVNPLSMLRQTSVIVIPARPDRRAIPGLFKSLAQAHSPRARSIAERLIEYSAQPELAEEMRAHLPELRVMLEQGNDKVRQAAIARLVLKLDPAQDKTEQTIDLSLRVLQGARFGELDAPEQQALELLKQHPESGKKIVPILVELLRRSSYNEKTKLLAMDALPAFGVANRPYLEAVHSILDDDLFYFPDVDAALAENGQFDWFNANHRNPADSVEQKRYAAERARQRNEAEQKAARSALMMPRWRNLVCAAFPLEQGRTSRRIIWEDLARIPPVECLAHSVP